MPNKGFSKISSDHGPRKVGEAPKIGKVPRSPQSGIKSRRGRSRRDVRKRRRKTVVLAWSTLLATLATLVLAVVIVLYFKNQREQNKSETAAHPPLTNLDNLFSPDTNNVPLPGLGETKALRIVSEALANRDPVLFLDYFVPPEIGTPAEATADLRTLIANEGPVVRMEWIGPRFANGRTIEEVVVFIEKDGKEINRLAQLVPVTGSDWLVDFDSYVRSSSSRWEYILKGEVPNAKVRVFVTKDSYYNGIFSDDKIWQSYAVVSPDAPEILYGYCKRDSPQDGAISKILSSEEKLHRATLEIRTHPEADARQYEISRVFAENWVLGEKAFDESF